MTNEEIRIKIAQAKGCHWYEVRGSAYLCSDSSRMMIDREAVRVDEPDPDSKLHFKVPNWPENIADAWELYLEMKQAGCFVFVGHMLDGRGAFRISPPGDINFEWYYAPDEIGAICLAWLAWDAARRVEK